MGRLSGMRKKRRMRNGTGGVRVGCKVWDEKDEWERGVGLEVYTGSGWRDWGWSGVGLPPASWRKGKTC